MKPKLLEKLKKVLELARRIYPENRIVVNYGDKEGLVLLGMIDTKSGEEKDIYEYMAEVFIVPSKYIYTDFNKLKSLDENNKEGFVVRFSNGFRMKVKFAEYVRLHKIITQCSNIAIWEHLRDGLPFDELLERVPDEFNKWLRETVRELQNKHNAIIECCKNSYQTFPTRKETAEYFKTQPYQSVLFAMLDGKDVNKIIWKLIKPQYSKPFKLEI